MKSWEIMQALAQRAREKTKNSITTNKAPLFLAHFQCFRV